MHSSTPFTLSDQNPSSVFVPAEPDDFRIASLFCPVSFGSLMTCKILIMKKIFFFTLILFATLQVSAQVAGRTPRWVSAQGYWVAESNKNQPLEHTIRFYNNDDVLVYQEKLSGVKLNLERRKVRMKLKTVLDAAVVAWQQQKSGNETALVRKALEN